MKNKKIISVFLSIVTVFVCLPFTVSAESFSDDAEYVEGEIIISSKKDVEDTLRLLHTASDENTVGIDFEDVGIENIEEIEIYSEEENVYLAEVDGNIEKVCRELNENDDIIAEPNYILHTADFTMPTEVSQRRGLYPSYQEWYFNNILHIPEAWQENEVTGNGVTIAIIDDGYNITAQDFPTNLWRNSNGTVGWNTYNDSDNISPIFKRDGTAFDNTLHGSNVAGVIGMTPNGSGGIGAAYGATLMLLQAANYVNESTRPSFTSAAIVSAVDMARENGADIINLSLGTTSNVSAISSAITRAYNAGILVIAAAGNAGSPTSSQKFYPASLSNVIGVMAIDKTDPSQLSDFSNYDTTGQGTYYDIAAPGVGILGCNATDTNYSLSSGTSQASPLVAAAAALYMEKYPERTIQELKSDMLASATELVSSYSSTAYHYKSLNAQKLLDYCAPPQIIINLDTHATLDGDYLYGLDEGYTDISDYITVASGTGTAVFTPTQNGTGTGSTVEIYSKDGRLFKTITVIIFGDVNGDSFADGQDAVLIGCITDDSSDFSTVQSYSADVDFDGLVTADNDNETADDRQIVSEYAIGDNIISQLR